MNNTFDREELLKKYYGYKFFTPKERLEILKNNQNFYISDDDLEELLKKKCTFGKRKNLSFRQYIKSYYIEFRDIIEEEVMKLTAYDYQSDIIILWGNLSRVFNKILGLDKFEIDENEMIVKKDINNIYDVDKLTEFNEVNDLFNNEFLLLDTETTGFCNLNQIIEFGGIIYNRKVKKDKIRLNEALKIATKENIFYIYTFFNIDDLLSSDNTLFKDISIMIKGFEKNNKFSEDLFNDFLLKNKNFLIKSELTLKAYLESISIFKLTHNRKIHFYIKPYKDYVNSANQSIHHISNDTILEKGLDFQTAAKGLLSILENQIIVGHNVKFDINKISELFNDSKIKGPNIKKVIDSINIFQVCLKSLEIQSKVNFFNLDYMTKLCLGIDLSKDTEGDRHTAIYDVNLTYKDLEKIITMTNNYVNISNVDEKKEITKYFLKNINKYEEVKDKNKEKIAEGQVSLFG